MAVTTTYAGKFQVAIDYADPANPYPAGVNGAMLYGNVGLGPVAESVNGQGGAVNGYRFFLADYHIILPSAGRPRKLIIALNGGGNTAFESFLRGSAWGSYPWRLVEDNQYALIAVDTGKVSVGNPLALRAIDLAREWGLANLPLTEDDHRIGILTHSMGGTAGFNWLRRNPRKCFGLYGVSTLFGINGVRTNPDRAPGIYIAFRVPNVWEGTWSGPGQYDPAAWQSVVDAGLDDNFTRAFRFGNLNVPITLGWDEADADDEDSGGFTKADALSFINTCKGNAANPERFTFNTPYSNPGNGHQPSKLGTRLQSTAYVRPSGLTDQQIRSIGGLAPGDMAADFARMEVFPPTDPDPELNVYSIADYATPIDKTGTTNVHAAVEAWLASVPNGPDAAHPVTARFESNGIYKCDFEMTVDKRQNFIIDFNGCTIKCDVIAAEQSTRSMFEVIGGKNVHFYFKGATLIGSKSTAAAQELVDLWNSTSGNQGMKQLEAFYQPHEWLHAININGTQGYSVQNNPAETQKYAVTGGTPKDPLYNFSAPHGTIRNFWGDGIHVTSQRVSGNTVMPSGGLIDGMYVKFVGRNGIAPVASGSLEVRYTLIEDSGYLHCDNEIAGADQYLRDVWWHHMATKGYYGIRAWGVSGGAGMYIDNIELGPLFCMQNRSTDNAMPVRIGAIPALGTARIHDSRILCSGIAIYVENNTDRAGMVPEARITDNYVVTWQTAGEDTDVIVQAKRIGLQVRGNESVGDPATPNQSHTRAYKGGELVPTSVDPHLACSNRLAAVGLLFDQPYVHAEGPPPATVTPTIWNHLPTTVAEGLPAGTTQLDLLATRMARGDVTGLANVTKSATGTAPSAFWTELYGRWPAGIPLLELAQNVNATNLTAWATDMPAAYKTGLTTYTPKPEPEDDIWQAGTLTAQAYRTACTDALTALSATGIGVAHGLQAYVLLTVGNGGPAWGPGPAAVASLLVPGTSSIGWSLLVDGLEDWVALHDIANAVKNFHNLYAPAKELTFPGMGLGLPANPTPTQRQTRAANLQTLIDAFWVVGCRKFGYYDLKTTTADYTLDQYSAPVMADLLQRIRDDTGTPGGGGTVTSTVEGTV